MYSFILQGNVLLLTNTSLPDWANCSSTLIPATFPIQFGFLKRSSVTFQRVFSCAVLHRAVTGHAPVHGACYCGALRPFLETLWCESEACNPPQCLDHLPQGAGVPSSVSFKCFTGQYLCSVHLTFA